MCCVQSAGFRGAICTARNPSSPQKASMHLQPGSTLVLFCVGGSASSYKEILLSDSGDLSLPCPAVSACRDLLVPGVAESKAVPCKHRFLCLQMTAGS